MKKAVYTCITGKYDELRPPAKRTPGWDYIAFTNNERIQGNGWDLRLITNQGNLDNARLARQVKILVHHWLPDYDLTVWCDGNLQPNCNMNELSKRANGVDLALMRHPFNKCIMQEYRLCVNGGKDNAAVMKRQVKRYQNAGMPRNFGMVQTGVLVRYAPTEQMKNFLWKWYAEVQNHSFRDQISFMYTLWRHPIKLFKMKPKIIEMNRKFKKAEHKKK